MGMDLALGALVLLSAVRGWFRGFMPQAIRLGGLVTCVYLAVPMREAARPYAAPQLPSVRPELLDKMLWWTSAVVAYVVLTGLTTAMLKASRRRPLGEPEPNRADQGAGFLLGGAKGFVVVAFLLAALQRYGLDHLKGIDWVEQQVESSRALTWSDQNRPADLIWSAPPVQMFVAHVRRNGLSTAAPADDPAERPEPARVQAAADRPRPLELPAPDRLDPSSPDYLRRLDETLRREGIRR